MERTPIGITGIALCVLLSPFPLLSQVSETAGIYRVDLPGGESQRPDVATGGDGGFIVVWRESTGAGASGVSGRRLDALGLDFGEPAELVIEPVQAGTDVTGPSVTMDAQGRFVVVWGESRISESCVEAERFDPLGVSLGRIVVDACSAIPHQPNVSVASIPDGRFAVAWDERTGAAATDQSVFLRLFTDAAQPRGGPVLVAQGGASTGAPSRPSVTLDYSGRPTVAFEREFAAPTGSRSYFRLFGATGQPRGDEILMGDFFGRFPAVAAAASGKLVTAREGAGILFRLFTAEGVPYERAYGSRFQEPVQAKITNPDISADSLGNIVAVWEEQGADTDLIPEEFRRPYIVVQAFNNRLALQSTSLYILPEAGTSYTNPAVALREDGHFLVIWESRPPGGPSRILSQLFQVYEEDDVCAYRGTELRCSTIVGSPRLYNELLQFGNGRAAGDRPFFADVDGDGDDDPCVRRGGAYLCDTEHDGGAAELVLPFGSPEHVPVMGNLDGDADDDPCVRRGRTFLCDTAHDGGEAEVKILFGLASDVPVLGDVDGDGDDDPCLFRPSTTLFLCDLDHDGTRDYVLDVDALPGDRPILGQPQINASGRDEFCVARGNRLLCDIDRTGGLSERLVYAGGGDYLLLGNIDGF